MPVNTKNFLAANRKANMKRWGFVAQNADLSFIDGASVGYDPQTLVGPINGTTGSDGNALFTYAAVALPTGHLLWKNGQKVIQGTAYTLTFSAGTVTIRFLAPYIPIAEDLLELQII